MLRRKHVLAGAAALAAAGALSAAPYPHGNSTPLATDLGDSAALEGAGPITVTVALNLSNRAQLDELIKSVYTPGNAHFRQFLSTAEFQKQFAPSAASVTALTHEFTAQGLTVTRVATTLLHVSGTAAQLEHAFAVQLHNFEVPASATTPSYRYRAPLGTPHVSTANAAAVSAVLGFDTQPRLHPHLHRAMQGPRPNAYAAHENSAVNTPDPPGQWTVLDYADYYDVNPLYQRGYTGKGQTLGIVTLASFTQSDAYTYWQAIGLKVNPNRINVQEIDGGSGPPSDASGSDETTLDVEQSGGLAPGANIIVYEAPNTSQGFVDAFAAAVDSNCTESVSTSWGIWELFDSSNPFGNGPVTNPVNGKQTTILQAYDAVLAQAALQGQTFYVASGDAGAYGSVAALPTQPTPPDQPYSFNPVLSVEDPAVQRYVTATGGTTLPGTQTYATPSGGTLSITIKQEQAWNWGYLAPLCEQILGEPADCLFPEGTGGGVSLYVLRPFYQWFTPNMANSPPGQALYQLTPTPQQLIAKLPAGYPGRNVPDISTNGDPQTGYLLYYTSSVNGFEIATYGGTSFVAPQLNGVTSLYVQALHHRVGLLNPALYLIALTPAGYYGRNPALHDITASNNWYWNARRGYDQTTGLGTPDVANLLDALRFIGY